MCYAYKPVFGADGTRYTIPHGDFQRHLRDGRIVPGPDGYHYAKETVWVLARGGEGIESALMRWDLVPRDFLKGENVSPEEAVKRKNSRARNPATGKSWGFNSFNARLETVNELWSFRKPWREGLRCAVPALAFKERPNMEGAPNEFRGREYELVLEGPQYLAGVHERWKSPGGGTIDSFSILTVSSRGHSLLESIWHERIPVLLKEAEVEQWLDAKTTPENAFRLCRPLPPAEMRAERVDRLPPAGNQAPPASPSFFDDPGFGM
jgi:putative SOS response-associated peptidase YedK